MSDYLTGVEAYELDAVEAVLDADPSSSDVVYKETIDLSERAIAAVAAKRAGDGGGGGGSQPGTLIVASELAVSVPAQFVTEAVLDGDDTEIGFTVSEGNLQPWVDVDGNIIKPGLFVMFASVEITTPTTNPALEVTWTGPAQATEVFVPGTVGRKFTEVFSLAASDLPYHPTTYISSAVDATGILAVDPVVSCLALATEE